MAALSGLARTAVDDRPPCLPSKTRRSVVSAASPIQPDDDEGALRAGERGVARREGVRDTRGLRQDPSQGGGIVAQPRQPVAVHRHAGCQPVDDRLTDPVDQRVVELRDSLLHPVPQPLRRPPIVDYSNRCQGCI
jgi:hypothetical protein